MTDSTERTEGVSVRVDMDLTPRLAKAWADQLRDMLTTIGDVDDRHTADPEGTWDVTTATLSQLVARSLDRQFAPFAEMHHIIDERDKWGDDWSEDFVWFGEAIEPPAAPDREDSVNSIIEAVYSAMDAGADEDDVRDVVEQAIDTWEEAETVKEPQP